MFVKHRLHGGDVLHFHTLTPEDPFDVNVKEQIISKDAIYGFYIQWAEKNRETSMSHDRFYAKISVFTESTRPSVGKLGKRRRVRAVKIKDMRLTVQLQLLQGNSAPPANVEGRFCAGRFRITGGRKLYRLRILILS